MGSILKFKEVREVFFSKPPICCSPETTIQEALEAMTNKGTGSIVITNQEGEALGIFTERDYLNHSMANQVFLEQPIEIYMTKAPKTVPENFRLDVAVGIMRLGKFRHLIVTENDSKKVIGVVSMRDFFNYFCDLVVNEI